MHILYVFNINENNNNYTIESFYSIAYKYEKIFQNVYKIENYVYDNNVGTYLNMFLIVHKSYQ